MKMSSDVQNLVKDANHNTSDILPFCALLSLIAIIFYLPVPNSNEFFYLPRLFSTYHPDFLAKDWSFGSGAPEHFVFNHTFGLLTLFLPMEIVGWLGRVAGWAATTAILFRLSNHFGVGGWGSAAALLIWIGVGQSILGGEWVFGTFEAKTFSYFFLFGAFVYLLEGKVALGAFSLGLSFSFHPAVGFWGGLATFFALPSLGLTTRRVAIFVIFSGIGLMPGAIPLLSQIVGSESTSHNDYEFLALTIMPLFLDPLSWPKRDILTLFLMSFVNWRYFLSNRSDKPIRFAFFFQTVTGVIFALGVGWRLFGRYDLLYYFPFRLFPSITPLFFFLFLAKAITECRKKDLGILLCSVWALTLLCLPNPISKIVDTLHANAEVRELERAGDELGAAFQWVAANTPQTAVGIVPPWRRDMWDLTKRAAVVNSHAPLYHRLSEWRVRIEKLMGPLQPDDTIEDYQKRYEDLSEESIREIAHLYKADFFVSRSLYAFPLLNRVGAYNIYWLSE